VNIPNTLTRIASTGAADKGSLDRWWTEIQQKDAPDAVLLDRIVFFGSPPLRPRHHPFRL